MSSVQKELGPERAAVSQVIAVDPFLEKHCEAMLDHGLDAPGLSRADGYFIVTLPGPNGNYDRIRVTGKVAGPVTPAIEKQLTERQRKMVSLLMNGEELTSRDCEARFGVTRPVIAKDFRQLLELGLAERIGSGRSTRYRAQPGR